MSVRAYRVITKEVADEPSFNLWHDGDLLDFLKDNQTDMLNYSESLNEDGNSGTIEINVGLLKKAIKGFQWEKDDYRLESIKNDIAFAKGKGNEYVIYECY